MDLSIDLSNARALFGKEYSSISGLKHTNITGIASNKIPITNMNIPPILKAVYKHLLEMKYLTVVGA